MSLEQSDGGGSAQRGPQLQVIDANKAPNFGAKGAEIFEKTVFTKRMPFLGVKGKSRPIFNQFDVLEPILIQNFGVL